MYRAHINPKYASKIEMFALIVPPSAPSQPPTNSARAHLHDLGGDEGEVSHTGGKSDEAPHGCHQSGPRVPRDIIGNVGVVGHHKWDGKQLGVQDGRKHQRT